MLAVPTPEAPQATCTLARPAIPPSPLRDRVGYSDHVRFRGYFPVHFIPAYNLPVYASQWPLPDTTQDSVRGCSLGFTAAAISGDTLQRACKAQPSQIPPCGTTAVGSSGMTHRSGPSVCDPRTQQRMAAQDLRVRFPTEGLSPRPPFQPLLPSSADAPVELP